MNEFPCYSCGSWDVSEIAAVYLWLSVNRAFKDDSRLCMQRCYFFETGPRLELDECQRIFFAIPILYRSVVCLDAQGPASSSKPNKSEPPCKKAHIDESRSRAKGKAEHAVVTSESKPQSVFTDQNGVRYELF